ncbi:MAG: rod shape-determining protein RodA [Actinomycetes bacterium]|jgi:rod shape determining protein RodA|nr:rod shape-determining protein RodA [Actinomycetes bacterium]
MSTRSTTRSKLRVRTGLGRGARAVRTGLDSKRASSRLTLPARGSLGKPVTPHSTPPKLGGTPIAQRTTPGPGGIAGLRAGFERWVNPVLVAVLIALLVFGAAFLRTAVHADSSFKRQLLGIGIGLVGLVVFWIWDYRKLKDWVIPLFILDVLLIVSPRIPGIGKYVNGAWSWLAIGNQNLFQPSEPAKLITILLLAAIVANYDGELNDWRSFLKVVGLSLIPFVAIMVQPDLGTGLVFIVIMLAILLVGGVRMRLLLGLIGAGAAAIALIFWVNTFTYDAEKDEYKILKKYQLERLTGFINPEADTKGASYNLKQSKIAIGSGELKGKGLGAGTQSNLNFLPERSTDFIFSVLGEETGFVGCVALMALYLALLLVALSIARASSDLYGTLITAGITGMWVFQILENAGMTMGVMPITGIPLPFMSYGSSFMITNLAAAGVLLSIWRHRPYQSVMKGAFDEAAL